MDICDENLDSRLVSEFADEYDPVELREPDYLTTFRLLGHWMKRFLEERAGWIMISGFLVIMLWGYHGHLEWLKWLLPAWECGGPGSLPGQRESILPGIPWDHELISFWGGVLLLVVVPMLLIKLKYRQPLRMYGLGLPPPDRRKLALWSFFILIAVSLPAFYFGTGSAEMQAEYPLFKGIDGWSTFVWYQLTYFPFFVAIEFIFRGYLLFGLAGTKDTEVPGAGGGVKGALFFSRYALLIQMLAYTAWHLGKPLPELFGTLPWGLFAGVLAYHSRSVWPVVLAHWLLNVFLDLMIWTQWTPSF